MTAPHSHPSEPGRPGQPGRLDPDRLTRVTLPDGREVYSYRGPCWCPNELLERTQGQFHLPECPDPEWTLL